MIVALHGGLYKEMIYGLAGGFITAVVFFIFIHYRVYKSDYYNEQYVYYSSGRKLIIYIGFLLVNFFVVYIIFFVFTMVFAGISNYIIKHF